MKIPVNTDKKAGCRKLRKRPEPLAVVRKLAVTSRRRIRGITVDGMPEPVDLRTDIFEVLRDPVGVNVDLEHGVVAVRGVSGLQEVVEHGTRFLRIARPKVGIDRQCHRRARMS